MNAQKHDSVQIQRLLDLIINILNLACDDNIPLTNKRLLEQSLRKLRSNSTISHRILQRAILALNIFQYTENPPLIVVESTEFDAITETILDLTQRKKELEQRHSDDVARANIQTQQIANQSELIKRMEREANILRERVEAAQRKCERAEEEKITAEIESRKLQQAKKEMEEKLERMRVMMRTEWVGTESLRVVDGTVHALTPTTLTQIIKLETAKWRTAFTLPIDEGEWELKIRRSEKTGVGAMLGFVRHPLPINATQFQCGSWKSGISGAFLLWSGGMWTAGNYIKPVGTNKKYNRVGQTAAIRVNMSTREARLFVDEEEQPGIFTDIPSPLCLGISTQHQNTIVEVLHFARTDALMKMEHAKQQSLMMSARITELEEEKKKLEEGKRMAEERQKKAEEQKGQAEREKAKLSGEVQRTRKELGEARNGKEKSEREKREMAEKMERMRMMMGPEWFGTESLERLNRTAHSLSPTTLTQIVKLDLYVWRTAFTFPIDEGEWELKIRGNNTIWFLSLGFVRHPLPKDATQWSSGAWPNGIGGGFVLKTGQMWKGGEFKPAGTNKRCYRVGQTAAIRVNMSTREARLIVDNEKQPGIFTNIPSPLCLGITTGFQNENESVEILHLARTDISMKVEQEKQKAQKLSARITELEEGKKKAERERARMEEEKRKAEAERMRMEEEKRRAEERTRRAEEVKRMTEERQKKAEEQKGQAEREKAKLSGEVQRTRKELGEARNGKEKSEREKREMAEKMERMRMMMRTELTGTNSLHVIDGTAHAITPTTLTQIIRLDIDVWRSAFTLPIDEGEWEFKIRRSEQTGPGVSLGFLRYPLPENSTQWSCGAWPNGIGGEFGLWNGNLWTGGEFRPEGTNKKCNRVGQTAAIRVNMRTREARLFVDEEEQPGIFTDIPSPLCLGITTQNHSSRVTVLHLTKL